ncbi:MAG: hypothetical protein ACXAEN_17855 [Candidatus Thorarchaeota archaeon]|jgi:hypothetical protein
MRRHRKLSRKRQRAIRKKTLLLAAGALWNLSDSSELPTEWGTKEDEHAREILQHLGWVLQRRAKRMKGIKKEV